MNLDQIAHIAELIAAVVTILGFCTAILPVVWKVNRAVVRVIDVLGDFPPHKHVNGHILYPKGYEPAREGYLKQT